MDLEREVRNLKRWNRVWIALFLFFVCFYCIAFPLFQSQIGQRNLNVNHNGTKISLTSSSDGPQVVTHLIAYGDNESEKRWAALPYPVAIIDSDGASIETKGLKWKDIHGEDASEPSLSRIEALYAFPMTTRSRNR